MLTDVQQYGYVSIKHESDDYVVMRRGIQGGGLPCGEPHPLYRVRSTLLIDLMDRG